MSSVTQGDCVEILQKKLHSNDFQLVSFHQSPLAEKNGFLGDHSKLHITITISNRKETWTFFVKTLPNVASQREYLEQVKGAFKEQQFFNQYISLLEQNQIRTLQGVVPECYLATEDLVVEEDLAARGFRTKDSRIPLSLAQVKGALTVLARLHASGLILEDVASVKLNKVLQVEESFYCDQTLPKMGLKAAKTGFKALVELMPKRSDFDEGFTQWAQDQIDQMTSVVKPSSLFRNTLCHADVWTKNFMFTQEPLESVLFDFQVYRYAPPGQDVMAFLHLTTDKSFRDRHFEESVEFYYKELISCFDQHGLEEVIPKSEFNESLAFYKTFSVVQSISHLQVVCLSEEISAELFSNADKARSVIFEDKYEFIKDVCRRDAVFRTRLLECVQELNEIFNKQYRNYR